MRLNSNKCKVLVFNHQQSPIILNGTELESVDHYKYLGIEIYNTLKWDHQWQKVRKTCAPTLYLIKQLKALGFNQQILMNVYRSYALSHFVYSAPVLSSTNYHSKEQMKKFQTRALKMIGVTPETAELKYKVCTIQELLDMTCINIITKILVNSTHAVTSKLTLNARSCTLNKRYRTSKAKTEQYNNSFLQKYPKYLRDGSANLYTHKYANNHNNKPKTAAICKSIFKAPPIKQKTNCPYCNQSFTVLKTHLRLKKICNSKQLANNNKITKQ